MKHLTAKEILGRLIKFNETNDWSVFDDVPAEQHVSVMYPHMTPETLQNMKQYYKEMED